MPALVAGARVRPHSVRTDRRSTLEREHERHSGRSHCPRECRRLGRSGSPSPAGRSAGMLHRRDRGRRGGPRRVVRGDLGRRAALRPRRRGLPPRGRGRRAPDGGQRRRPRDGLLQRLAGRRGFAAGPPGRGPRPLAGPSGWLRPRCSRCPRSAPPSSPSSPGGGPGRRSSPSAAPSRDGRRHRRLAAVRVAHRRRRHPLGALLRAQRVPRRARRDPLRLRARPRRDDARGVHQQRRGGDDREQRADPPLRADGRAARLLRRVPCRCSPRRCSPRPRSPRSSPRPHSARRWACPSRCTRRSGRPTSRTTWASPRRSPSGSR